MRLITFVVEGLGEFPYDMLRYDSCFPFGPEAVYAIWSKKPKLRRVKLGANANHKGWLPTIDRWESFGFRVIPESITDEAIS